MIYTVTFNPAWDYVVYVNNMRINTVNRAFSERLVFGGKGINVSAVLKELGQESIILGFIAGFTGNALEKELKSKGFKTDFIKLTHGMTRINVKINSDSETEINGQGPGIDDGAIKELFDKMNNLNNGDTLVLSGSVPKTVPENIYERILEIVSNKHIRIVVDAEKNLLINALKYKPFLVKPNIHELGEIFGVELSNNDEIKAYAKKLKQMGAENVLVSMGKDGAILIDSQGICIKVDSAKGEMINSVGAGDSMIAGFLAEYEKSEDYCRALKLATAAGGATAFSHGLASKDKIYEVLKTI